MREYFHEYSNTGAFSFQLPVSVYESVIDIISGEVPFFFFSYIYNLQMPSSEPFWDIGLINLYVYSCIPSGHHVVC